MAHMSMVQSLPLKKQNTDDYFSGTKQSKNKGKRKKKTEIVINLKELERPLLEAAAQQKPVLSDQRSGSACRQQTPVDQPPGITCWQQKSGSELFPNVQTRPLTICGVGRTEEELLKLALEESLKTYKDEKVKFIDLNEANRIDHQHLKKSNNAGIQLPLPEPVENESWDCPEEMGQIGSLSILEKRLTVADQMKDNPENSKKHHGRQKPQLNKESESVKMGGQKKYIPRNNDETNLATDKKDGSTGHCGTREDGQSKSSRLESDSCYKDIISDLNHVKRECDERIWGPLKNDDECGIKKHDQNQSNSVSDPFTNWGESKTHTYVPQDSSSRTQEQVDWSESDDHYENVGERLSGSYRNQGESMTQMYKPQASDISTHKPTDWIQEKALFENQKFHSDHNPVPKNVRIGRSQGDKYYQENAESGNQNYVEDDKSVYCYDTVWKTEKNNEWDGETKRDSSVQKRDHMSQGARICKAEKASSFGRDERLKIPEKRIMRHFSSKESEDSGTGMFTDAKNKVQSDLGKCIDSTILPHDKNDNHCYSEMLVEQFFNYEPLSVQKSPQDVAQAFATQIHDAHLQQTHSPLVDSPTFASQFHHAASSFLPPVTSTAEVSHSTSRLPALMGMSMPPHLCNTACQVPNQACQPVPAAIIQKLFELFMQEQQQHIMSMNYLLQMAVMNSTGLPNTQPDPKLQAQQTHSASMLATLGGFCTSYNDLLLQNNALLNPSVPQMVGPSMLGMDQTFSVRNTPIPNASINLDTTVSSLPDVSTLILHHGDQTSNSVLMPSPSTVDPKSVTHQNYQSAQTQMPAVGNMNNMMQLLTPGPNNQPFGARPMGVATSSKMVFNRGRGRLNI
ncbi:uncharacterized protein LOC110839150 isoform X2 [Zootermopsis nevadensis]|nr:uncharacterized protein LOC110839150 isoform X2 [Zootermopsis nevadensis]